MTRRNSRGRGVLTALLLLLALPSTAQQVLDYAACLEQMLQRNLPLQQAHLDAEAASLQLQLRRAGRLPAVNGQVRTNYSVGRSVDPLTNGFINRNFNSLTGSVTAGWYLFEGFRAANAIKAAKQEVAQRLDLVEATKNDLAVDLALVYVRLNYLQELRSRQQQQLKQSAQLVELMQLKVTTGHVTASEVFKLRAQQATDQLALVNTHNDLQLAYLELRQLMNYPPGDSIRIQPLSAEILEGTSRPLPTAGQLAHSVDSQPALRAKEHNALRWRHEVAVARASLYPSLQLTGTLGSNYSNTSSNFDFATQLNSNRAYGTGFVLTVPVFNGFKYRLLTRQSQIQWQQSQLEVDQERNRLVRVVQEAAAAARAAAQSWQSAQQAEEYARRSYEADRLRLQHGAISVFEFVQTKTAYANAQLDLVKTKYEAVLRARLVEFYQGDALTL